MKKTFLFAAFAALCMTSCMNEEFPNAPQVSEPGYGYINLNVSNDPIMVTRAGVPSWLISATKDDSPYTGIESGVNKVPEGTYVITAKSHNSIDEANTLNKYGEPYFEGVSSATQVSAGESKSIGIDCGVAQNSKLTLVNELNTSVFSDVKLNATSPNRELSLSKDNPSAFYSIRTTVNYNISYKYNGGVDDKFIKNNGEDYTISIAEAAKDYQIKLTSTDNGNITVSVTYNSEFNTVESEEFTVDAATGGVVNDGEEQSGN